MSEGNSLLANEEVSERAKRRRYWINVLLTPVVAIVIFGLGAIATVFTMQYTAAEQRAVNELKPELDVSLALTRTNFGPNEPRMYSGLISFNNGSLRKIKIINVTMTVFSCLPSDDVVARVDQYSEIERLHVLRDYYVEEKLHLKETAKAAGQTGDTHPIQVAAFLDNQELEKGFHVDSGGQYQGFVAQTLFVSSDNEGETQRYVDLCDKRVSEIEEQIESLSQAKPDVFVVVSDLVGDYEFEKIRTIEFGKESELPSGQKLDRSFQVVEIPQKNDGLQSWCFYRLDICFIKEGSSESESIFAECFTNGGNTEVGCTLIAN